MKIRILIAAILISFILLLGNFSKSEEQEEIYCDKTIGLVSELEDKYTETMRVYVMTAEGFIVSIFESADRNGWTLTISYPNGMSCVIDHGFGPVEWVDPKPSGEQL